MTRSTFLARVISGISENANSEEIFGRLFLNKLSTGSHGIKQKEMRESIESRFYVGLISTDD